MFFSGKSGKSYGPTRSQQPSSAQSSTREQFSAGMQKGAGKGYGKGVKGAYRCGKGGRGYAPAAPLSYGPASSDAQSWWGSSDTWTVIPDQGRSSRGLFTTASATRWGQGKGQAFEAPMSSAGSSRNGCWAPQHPNTRPSQQAYASANAANFAGAPLPPSSCPTSNSRGRMPSQDGHFSQASNSTFHGNVWVVTRGQTKKRRRSPG